MARKTLSPDLKKAIVKMPATEKDKLLLRLLVKDQKLIDRLEYELLEGGHTKDSRREEVRSLIETSLQEHRKHYYSPGYLLLLMRDLSGTVTRHVAATKDKYGEVELNFLMMNLAFDLFADKISTAKPVNAQTFNEHIVKRTLKLLSLISKMHEDLHLDFLDSMKKLGNHIGNQPTTMKVAIYNALDVNWLLRGKIP